MAKEEKNKLPIIGRAGGKQEEGRAISRERGFNYDTTSADDDYVQSRQTMLQEEKKMRASQEKFGPKNVPRFQHPDDRKRMAAVKSDYRYLQLSSNYPTSVAAGFDSTEEVEMPYAGTPPPGTANSEA